MVLSGTAGSGVVRAGRICGVGSEVPELTTLFVKRDCNVKPKLSERVKILQALPAGCSACGH